MSDVVSKMPKHKVDRMMRIIVDSATWQENAGEIVAFFELFEGCFKKGKLTTLHGDVNEVTLFRTMRSFFNEDTSKQAE